MTSLNVVFFVELNKTNEVKVWLTIYSYFDASMIMVIIIKKKKLSKEITQNSNFKNIKKLFNFCMIYLDIYFS